jgi:hypothetical protein
VKRIFSLFGAILLAASIARADIPLKNATTSKCFDVFVSDSSVTTGAGKTGLSCTGASCPTCYYREEGGAATSITMASSTLGTYTSGAFKEIDATNTPGWYEFCPPNAALDGGIGKSVFFQCKGVTNMAPMNLRVNLTPPSDVEGWAGTAPTTPQVAGQPDVTVANDGITNLSFKARNTAQAFTSTTIQLASAESFDADAELAENTSVYIVSAQTGAGQTRCILSYVNSTDTATVDAWTTTPTCTPTACKYDLIATPNCSGKANLTKIDGNATATNSATLNLAKLNIVNSAGDAIVASSTGSNGNGINASGNGTGAGIKGTGGATGNGEQLVGGSTSGSGFKSSGTAGNAHGFELVGQGSANGLKVSGGATGHAILIVGGGTSGDGLVINTTSGNGITSAPTAGHGLSITGNGTSKHGIVATGGGAGTSDGLKAVAGTGGVDIRGAVTGNITGSIDSLGATAKTDVYNQIIQALATDTYAELTSCPASTASFATMLRYIYMISRNKLTQSTTTQTLLRNDDTTALCTSAVADSSGVFTRGRFQ